MTFCRVGIFREGVLSPGAFGLGRGRFAPGHFGSQFVAIAVHAGNCLRAPADQSRPRHGSRSPCFSEFGRSGAPSTARILRNRKIIVGCKGPINFVIRIVVSQSFMTKLPRKLTYAAHRHYVETTVPRLPFNLLPLSSFSLFSSAFVRAVYIVTLCMLRLNCLGKHVVLSVHVECNLGLLPKHHFEPQFLC